MPLESQNPYPIIVNFWSVLLPFIDPILVTFGHYSLFLVYFVANYRPHLSHFWANNFLTLKVTKKCEPILVTLTIENAGKGDPIIVSRVMKMQPHPAAKSFESVLAQCAIETCSQWACSYQIQVLLFPE